jgi:hypothetical protein
MRRIQAQRRQHRRDLPIESLGHFLALHLAQLRPFDEMNTVLGQLRPDHIAVAGSLLRQQRRDHFPLTCEQISPLLCG